ncbi:hypothetical protein GWI33_022099 [Rhynchophorus ferrugineus]|uniref:Guanine deaminase n=1 Tax=Rhynchophorus ferrugineus TaxID=354439 RepID=A0A834IT74_RHYFE|nr:hypothetical protein GWI33_022099 [Rhynchophorus ferrugineus]
MSEKVRLFIGNIFHSPEKLQVQLLEGGFVAVKDRKIIAVGDADALKNELNRFENEYDVEKVTLKASQVLVPGFVDTHIHAPQYPNCGLGYDKTLLDWLNLYTFELERKYRDLELAEKVFDSVVKKSIEHGTTTACYFGSLFADATIVLADAVEKYGQRALVGKINMTQCTFDDYRETEQESLDNTIRFVENVLSRKNDLVQPIITPRFALSVDIEHMTKLSEIAKTYDLHIQSHVSENKDEIALIHDIYDLPYAEVYDKANILTKKTVLAHGIYLSDDELKLILERDTAISHCPDSNTCIKSGLCDVRRFMECGIKVGLGTDISGGFSPSIRQAMKSALDVSIHISFNRDNYEPLTYKDVFYLATLGGAEALAMDDKIGNFEPGKEFDALIIDVDIKDGQIDYLIDCSPWEVLQKFIYSGDDRNILEVYVSGRKLKG